MKLVIVSTLGATHRYVVAEVARRCPPALVIQPISSPSPRKEPEAWTRHPVKRLEQALSHRARSARMERAEARLEELLWGGAVPHVAAARVPVSELHSEALLGRLRALAPDLMLVSGAPLLRPELFTLPRLGTLNLHYGIAPAYRGEDTLFWPLVKGDHQNLGVTLHFIDRGIDTGRIVAHGFLARQGGESETELWAEAARLGARLILRVLDGEKGALPTGTVQSGSGKQYFRRERTLAWEARHWLQRTLGKPLPAAPERIVMY